MRTTTEPRIAAIKINGYDRFRLSYPTTEGRKREHFSNRKDAEARLKELRNDARRFGETAAAMTSGDRADAVAAIQILSGTGRTLTEAARRLKDELERIATGMPVRDAVAKFLASRDTKTDKYRRTLSARMNLFAGFFEGRNTASITPDDCQRFLDGLAGRSAPRTVSHNRTHLSVFFGFCKARGWHTDNPIAGTAPVTVEADETAILDPQTAATLLSACDPAILPGVVLGMFCGLRQAEIERIEWPAVKLDRRIVVVTSRESRKKGSARRIVPISENAMQWLAPHVRTAGRVWPDEVKARDLWTLARVRAGFGPFFATSAAVGEAQTDPKTGEQRTDLKPWPGNALRHSAISYRLANDTDLPKLAYESGNSPKMIQKHYNELAEPQDAKLFFAIVPATPKNVLKMPAAPSLPHGDNRRQTVRSGRHAPA